jgi:iron complex outermembrane receptor protein
MVSSRAAICIAIAFIGFPIAVWAEPGPDDQDSVTNEAAVSDPEDASEPEDADDIESLVVTARRRPELLQETPVAATVLGGELLQQRGVDSLEDIGAYVPNLTAFSGVQHQGSFYSRGVGQRDSFVTLDPGVGIYVDDVYVARGQGALLPTLDLERIEALRGPQGTLYGKNTIGGAIKLISEKPGPEPYIAGALGGGEYDSINGGATLNAPIVDGLLYSRFAFVGRSAEGYTENTFNGERYNDDDLKAARAQFRLLPLEAITLDLSGHYASQSMEARASKCRVSNATLAGFIPGLAASCGAAQRASTYRFATELDERYFLDSYGTSLVAAWEAGPAFGLFESLDLKSVSAWQQQEVEDGFLDLDATALPYLSQQTLDPQRQTQWSQEIQAVAAALDDRMRITAGLYGFWEDTGDGDVLSNNFFVPRIERTEIRNDSYAAYGQTSVTPLAWLELTGGIRGTWETKRAKRTIVCDFGFPCDGTVPAIVDRADKSFEQVTPMGGISLKAPDSWLSDLPVDSGILYFTYSEGYKSGGFATRRDPSVSQIPDFDAEQLDNYELGTKLDFWNSRVLLNAAFFYSEYEDIQLTVARVNPASAPFQPDIGSSIANAGKANIKGLELELVTRPWDALVVRGSVGVTDAEYDEFDDQTWDINPGTGAVENIRTQDRSNETFYNVPELSLDGSIEYPLLLERIGLPDWGTVTPLVHAYYQTETDTHFTAAGYASRRFRQDDYTIVDLRLIWDLPDDRTQLTLFVDNVGDTHYFDSSVDLTNTIGIGGVYYARPRFFGAEIRYRWHDPSFLRM